MIKVKNIRIISFSVFGLIAIIVKILHINGNWYFYFNIALSSLAILSGIILSIYSIKSSADRSKREFIFYIISTLIFIVSSLNLYIDLFVGKDELINDQYYIYSKEFAENNPGLTKSIKIPYNDHYIEFYITEQQWEYLINNNELNHDKRVIDPVVGDSHNPHYHPIRVTFYEKSKIICDIQIIE